MDKEHVSSIVGQVDHDTLAVSMPTAIYLVLAVIWKSVNTSGTIAVTNIFLPFFSWLECIFIAIFSGATCVVTWGCRHSYILHFIIYWIILHFTILFSNPYVHSFARGTIGNVTTHILEFKPGVLYIQSHCTFKSDDSYMILFGCRTNIVGGLCIMVQPSDVIHTRRDERNRTPFILYQTRAYKTKWNQCPAPNLISILLTRTTSFYFYLLHRTPVLQSSVWQKCA